MDKSSARAMVEECEPRILFSADLLTVHDTGAAQAGEVRTLDFDLALATTPTTTTTANTTRIVAEAATRGGAGRSTEAMGRVETERAAGRELIFIDAAVDDPAAFIAGQLGDGVDRVTYVIPAGDNALAWITGQLEAEAAEGRAIEALHLVSHGAAGELILGGERLDRDGLADGAALLQRWDSALARDADLLLYGCEVGAGEAGQAFLQALSQYTGANVAASTDVTGHIALGGNWLLEASTGRVTTEVAFSAGFQLDWTGSLATYTVTTVDNAGAGSLRAAIDAANSNPGLDTIDFDIPGTGVHVISLTSLLPALTSPVVLDATTDDSHAANGNRPAIIVDGDNLVGNGLVLAAGSGGSTISGLVFRDFEYSGGGGGSAIVIQSGSAGNTIAGNYLGSFEATGDTAGSAERNAQHGLVVGSSGNTLINNVASGNGGHGIFIQSTSAGNLIQGNRLGTNATGIAAIANAGQGLRVEGQTNHIDGNLISGNTQQGVQIVGESADGNRLTGNRIGTDLAGTAAIANGSDGLQVRSGADNTIVGGFTVAERNLISGNNEEGLEVSGESTDYTEIYGNYIGTDVTGMAAIPNARFGLALYDGARHTTIGSADPAGRNVISGNGTSQGSGIHINGNDKTSTRDNVIVGNYIGVDATGLAALANVGVGIDVFNLASDTVIGGPTAAHGNVIAASGTHGIDVRNNATRITIQNNLVGTNALGTAALPNGAEGIRISGPDNTVRDNLSSGNVRNGILLDTAGASGITVAGNKVGTNLAGTAALGNGYRGIDLVNGANNNVVGGLAEADRNLASGNVRDGIALRLSSTSNNQILGNYAGLGADGTTVIANQRYGIAVLGGAGDNLIGGLTAAARNVVSGNGSSGIFLDDYTNGPTMGPTWILGNIIGVAADGLTARGNGFDGVQISDASRNVHVGDGSVSGRNLIAANARNGVTVQGSTTHGIEVLGNYIGSDQTGTQALPNVGHGVHVLGGAHDVAIGSASASAGNLIVGNGGHGVLIEGQSSATATAISVRANWIGLDASGTAALGNDRDGVRIGSFASGVVVGGTLASDRNVIAGNGGNGISIVVGSGISAAGGQVVSSNFIGTNVTGSAALGNAGHGIYVETGANTIGGSVSAGVLGTGNLVSGNLGSGVVLSGSQASGNAVVGNFIGVDITGEVPLGNAGNGVWIRDGAAANQIGGPLGGAENVISGNGATGVRIDSAGAPANTVAGNLIGLSSTRGAALANAAHGVHVASGEGQVIGSVDPGRANVIAGNRGVGVLIDADAVNAVVQGNDVGWRIDPMTAIGNDDGGVWVAGSGNLIGGDGAAEGNRVIANGGAGIRVTGNDNAVSANRVGTTAGGLLALANGGAGIIVSGSGSGNRIGGTAAGQGNRVAFNQQAGIIIRDSAVDNAIVGNLVYENAGLAIDLGGDGPTANDVGDGDSGPNHRQNHPGILGATNIGGDLSVHLQLDSLPPGPYRIEIFLADPLAGDVAAAAPRLVGHGEITSGAAIQVVTLAGIQMDENEVLTATATRLDGAGGLLSTSEVSDGVPLNHAPSLTSEGGAATAALLVDEGASDVSIVTGTDPDLPAQTLSFLILGGADAGRFTLAPDSGVLSFVTPPVHASPLDSDGDNVYEVTVAVSDGRGGLDSQALTISINGFIGPVLDVDADPNAVPEGAAAGTSVSLTARAVDPNPGDHVSYSLDDDAGGRFAIDASSGQVTVVDGRLLDHETHDSHQIRVRATSSDGSASVSPFIIHVLDVNEPLGPIVDVDPAPDAVDENAGAGAPVGITAEAIDPDQSFNVVSYALTDGAEGRFEINPASGVVTVATGAQLDFETGDSYQIVVLATSADGSTSSETFTIAIRDVDEPVGPVTDVDSVANAVDENAANGTEVGVTARAVDPDLANNAVSYSLTDSAGGRFAINAVTGVVTVANGALLDYEAEDTYQITVLATSEDGTTSSQVFTIAIRDVDEPVGPVTDIDPAANGVDENAANGTEVGVTARAVDPDLANSAVSYSLTDSAGGRFAINAVTGVATVANGALLDYEVRHSYQITVLATSENGTTSSETFTIAIRDVDEPVGPVTDVDSVANAVDENAANGTEVGVTARAVDPDLANNAVSYSLSDNAGGRFAIDAVTGVVTVANGTLLDYEVEDSYQITVLATSEDGSTSSETFTIAIRDVDEPVGPVTDIDPAANGVDENAANGTEVGVTARAVDPDLADNAVSYSLTDSAEGRFAINAVTGVVTVANGALLDYEAEDSYQITVLATSEDGTTSSRVFTIAIRDVNEPLGPVGDIDPRANAVDERASGGTEVGIRVSALDPDGDVIAYQLVTDAGGRFQVDAVTGIVTVGQGVTLHGQGGLTHAIVVRALSADGTSEEGVFQVLVRASEPPTPPEPGSDDDLSSLEEAEPAPGPLPPEPAVPQPSTPEPAVPQPSTPEAAEPATPPAGPEDSPVEPRTPPPLIPSGDAAAGASEGPSQRPVALSADLSAGPPTAPPTAPPTDPPSDRRDGERTEGLAVEEVGADEGPRGVASAPAEPAVIRAQRLAARADPLVVVQGPPALASIDLAKVEVDLAGENTGPARVDLSGRILELDVPPAIAGLPALSTEVRLQGVEVLVSSASGVAMTVGFVWWLTRSGGLLALILMGVPAWRHVDLLPVLSHAREEGDPSDPMLDDDGEPEPEAGPGHLGSWQH